MPSCYAQDVAKLLMLNQPLVSSTQGVAPSATRRDPSSECDPDWCRIADWDGGERCPPGKCRHRGREEDKAKCRHELWGRPPLAGARQLSAADKKAAALWKARADSAREVHASLERLAKALREAKAAKVLAPGEDEMLRLIEGWKKLFAAERRPRRK